MTLFIGTFGRHRRDMTTTVQRRQHATIFPAAAMWCLRLRAGLISDKNLRVEPPSSAQSGPRIKRLQAGRRTCPFTDLHIDGWFHAGRFPPGKDGQGMLLGHSSQITDWRN